MERYLIIYSGFILHTIGILNPNSIEVKYFLIFFFGGGEIHEEISFIKANKINFASHSDIAAHSLGTYIRW